VDAESLSHRLLLLRQRRWDEPITQPVLGSLLGVKAPTISSWERGEAVPPHDRIVSYATLFASRRSLDAGGLLDEADLTDAEQAERAALLADLTQLRQRALEPRETTAPDPDPLRFADGAPIRIICGKLDAPPKTAGGHRWNYMALSAYADLDALLELHGHLRARNPDSDVRYKLAGRVEGHDLRAHLVLLGNLALMQTDLRHLMPRLPVSQVVDESAAPDGEVFELASSGERFGPVFTGEGEERRVVGDVGLVARMPSPVDATRTLTVFSGVYTRGVYGAVRCLTDREIGPANARWLHDRFEADTTYGVLMRVRGADHAIATPRLSDPDVREHEFSTT
jgi:transcriptional regulator with XRE-family HTH domain